MQVRPADGDDLATYAALGRAAQAWLQARRFKQYVPAAHEEYTTAIESRVTSGTLFAVHNGVEACGFFSLDSKPSPWWQEDVAALYLGGMVVHRSASHLGSARSSSSGA